MRLGIKKKKNLADEAVKKGELHPEKKKKKEKGKKAEAKEPVKTKEEKEDKEIEKKFKKKKISSVFAKKKIKRKKLKGRQLLRKYLDKAGFEDMDEHALIVKVFRIVVIACLTLSAVVLVIGVLNKNGAVGSIGMLITIWTAAFAALFIFAWLGLYVFLDVRVFKRTSELEEVLPDYLQLASANISAGMPIDRALWYAVRPRFGILAKEIEDVAKSTVSGEDLKVALSRFADRFDSAVLKRSINLLLVGMESGGEIAELLNKIAINIQETRILKKEMAANVMTYAIFIGFASVAAAPILYALSGRLLIIIQQIMGMLAENMPADGGGVATGMINLQISDSAGMSQTDFGIFAMVTVLITAMMSGLIISVIRKGNIKEGFRIIPMLVLAALALYFVSSWALGALLGGIMNFG